MSARLLAFFFVISLIAHGCSKRPQAESDHPPTSPSAAEIQPAGVRLTMAEAAQLAQQAAVGAGYHLDDFKQSDPHYLSSQTNIVWLFDFRRKVPVPEDHPDSSSNFFSVSIVDGTRETGVMILK
jgi:hypothetical protein